MKCMKKSENKILPVKGRTIQAKKRLGKRLEREKNVWEGEGSEIIERDQRK